MSCSVQHVDAKNITRRLAAKFTICGRLISNGLGAPAVSLSVYHWEGQISKHWCRSIGKESCQAVCLISKGGKGKLLYRVHIQPKVTSWEKCYYCYLAVMCNPWSYYRHRVVPSTIYFFLYTVHFWQMKIKWNHKASLVWHPLSNYTFPDDAIPLHGRNISCCSISKASFRHDFILRTHCLKINQNVSFEFSKFLEP